MSRSTPTPAKGRPGPAPRYTKDEVFEAALRVIEGGSPDAFTMRALAEELGIGVMTLYGYAADKEEIVEGATLAALKQSRHEPPAGGTWEEMVGTDVRLLHEVCRRHPTLTSLVISQRTRESPRLFGVREHMLTTLLDAGFDRSTAMHALGVLIYYALGFASAQAATTGDLADRIKHLPAGELPSLTAAAADYPAHVSDDAFEFGLELLIDGLARNLTPA